MKKSILCVFFVMINLFGCQVATTKKQHFLTQQYMLEVAYLLANATNRVAVVSDMINDGFPVNQPAFLSGSTLLHKAIIYGDEQLIRYLLEQGASLEIENDGDRPVDYVENGHTNNIWKIIESFAPVVDDSVDGMPKYFLSGLVNPYEGNRDCFLYINGKSASPKIIDWLKSRGVVCRASDYVESSSPVFMKYGPEASNQPCYIYEILYEIINDKKVFFEVKLRREYENKEDGTKYYTLLSYGKGEYIKKHGFWFYNSIIPATGIP